MIKLGMDTNAVIGRFEAERQALAMMDHPNIAKVFDGGETETGRPFFVMELVEGAHITAYCDQKRLSIVERLELFMEVCHAVQHAHQRGIIHRDLKPSNILIAVDDGKPVTKVIDFGIAKATQGRLNDSTLFTAFEQFMGTPAYMSPEQADLGGEDVDTRSDVYSLGVLLYELLAGSPPFAPGKLNAVSLHELRRILCEEEPRRPSVHLASIDRPSRAAVANQRNLSAEQLVQLLAGDLDWIVTRALEKERARRYATCRDLALDVQRYLDHEPVSARSPTAVYRLRKYARRNRSMFSALVVVFIALLGGLAIALAGMRRAIAEQHTAENALEEAEAVTEFLTTTVGAADAARTGRDAPLRAAYFDTRSTAALARIHSGRDVSVREVLEKASRGVGTQFPDRPLLQARLHEAIGETYRGLGVFEAACEHLRAAVDLRTRTLGTHHPDTLRAAGKLAWVLVMTPDNKQAMPLALATVADYEQISRPDKQDLANAYFALSFAEFVHAGMQEQSFQHIQKSVALFSDALGAQHPLTVSARVELAIRQWTTERYDDGLANCRELMTIENALVDHPARAQLYHAGALITEELGDYAASAEYARRCDEVRTRLLGEEHYETYNARFFRAFALAHIEKDPREHIQEAEKILQLQDKLVSATSPNRPMVMSRTAQLLAQIGRTEEAVALARGSIGRLQVFFGNAPFAFRALADLAMLESQAGDFVNAEQRSRALLEVLAAQPRRYEYSYSRAKLALATSLVGARKWAEAELVLRENEKTLLGLNMNTKQQLELTRHALAQVAEARARVAGPVVLNTR